MGGTGGGGGKGEFNCYYPIKMAAVKFRGEGLSNHNPA